MYCIIYFIFTFLLGATREGLLPWHGGVHSFSIHSRLGSGRPGGGWVGSHGLRGALDDYRLYVVDLALYVV